MINRTISANLSTRVKTPPPASSQQKSFNILSKVVEHLVSGNQTSAEELISIAEASSDFKDVLPALFLRALIRRCDPLSQRGNLYLEGFENSQIDLFNLMAQKVSLVSDPGKFANYILFDTMRSFEEVVLVDVGAGTGRQMLDLLKLFTGSSQRRTQRIKLVGIEPAHSALEIAIQQIESFAKQTSLDIQFIPLQECAENLTTADWQRISSLGENIFINAAFTLHHIANRKHEQKNLVLKHIAALHPKCFVLCEPHSNHETRDLMLRLQHAWNHFGLAFKYIDQLDLSITEAGSLKTQFWGREIEDILSADDEKRSERHEEASSWIARLEATGFSVTAKWPQEIHNYQGKADITLHSKHLSFNVQGEPIVSLIQAEASEDKIQ